MYCQSTVVPLQDRVAGELTAVVAYDHLRLAALLDDPVQLTGNAQSGKRCIDGKAQAFTGAFVHDRQLPEPEAMGEMIRHKVQRPKVIGGKWDADSLVRRRNGYASISWSSQWARTSSKWIISTGQGQT